MKLSANERAAFVILAFVILLTASPLAFAQSKRAMTIDDVMAMRTVSDPRLSPDGRQVAFVVTAADMQTNARNSDVWVISVEGGEARRLTFSPKRDDAPRWAADSRRLAFISDRDGKAQVYLIAVDGGEAQRLTDVKTAVQNFAWSPDGQRIAYIATDPVAEEREKEKKAGFDQIVADADYSFAHISIIDVERNASSSEIVRPVKLTDGALHVSELAWSPDGKVIAFAARRTPKLSDTLTTEIYAIAVVKPLGTPVKLTDNNRAESNLAWAPDGAMLSYLATSDQYPSIGPSRIHLLAVNRITFTGSQTGIDGFVASSPPKILLPQFEGYITNHQWSPDGKLIYFAADVGVYRRIYRMLIDGTKLEAVIAPEGLAGSFSLSARSDRIAFLEENSEQPADVYTASTNEIGGYRALTRQVTRMHPQAGQLALGRTEVIRWKSAKDNREIEGLLVYPIDYDARKRYPLITSLHGGPEGAYQLSFMAAYSECPHVYAARGYLSFFPNFRGSSNYGAGFAAANVGDLGGGDYQDVLSGIDYIIQRGMADPERLAIKGYSYGGYMAGWMIGHTTRFKAAAFGAGLSNAISYYSTGDIQYQRETLHQGTPWRNNPNMIERSPVFYLQNARTPSLIYHGEKDERVPLGQSMETYMGLKQAGVATEMVIYPREGHGLREPAHQLDKLRRELAWIEKYVRGE
jgi:dipeptidyl aminopeptidase/acylaminoacyl peptidase